MELIAATRVVKAMQRADAARPYSRQITSVIENLAAGGAETSHPLLRQTDEVKRVGFIVMAGDRGLAGAYNTNPIRAAERQLQSHRAEGKDYVLFAVGKKSAAYFGFRNYRVDYDYQGFTDAPSYEDARRIADDVAAAFISGEVDEVELIYTEFVSMGTQRVSVRRFLPLEDTAVMAESGGGDAEAAASFEFEPSPDSVLEALLPRYIEARLFGALLDCAASEHANRQRAMKSATDNAEELITKLSREMNAARQAAITTEIMEIVGGAEALDDSGNGAHAVAEGMFAQIISERIDLEIACSRPDRTASARPCRWRAKSPHTSNPIRCFTTDPIRLPTSAPSPKSGSTPPKTRRASSRRPTNDPAGSVHPRSTPHHSSQEHTPMTVTENELKNGRIVGIAGPVVDVEFPAGALPEINTQLEFDIIVDGEAVNVPAEVAQQIGDNRVRAIAMKPTDGLVRGAHGGQHRSRRAGTGGRRHPRSHLERDG